MNYSGNNDPKTYRGIWTKTSQKCKFIQLPHLSGILIGLYGRIETTASDFFLLFNGYLHRAIPKLQRLRKFSFSEIKDCN